MYISGLKMKDAQGFCLDDAPPASDEDGVRAVRAKFFEYNDRASPRHCIRGTRAMHVSP